MVAIRPFCGLRYDSNKTPDLSAVIAPPYDVIDATRQEQLYQRSPHNVIRLILGRQMPQDSETDNRYTRSRRDYDAWRKSGILSLDPKPALYLIRQTFEGPSGGPQQRLGFIALMSLDENTRRQVYRHEMTLAAPKADRTRLLQAVPANLEPIFCVYPDEQGSVQEHLTRLSRQSPAVCARLDGEAVDIWPLTDAAAIEPVMRHLGSVSVLIADGHHRFEAGFANRARFGAIMTYFVSMRDPGLVVRPIHRVVHPPSAFNAQQLAALASVEPLAGQEEAVGWLSKAEGPGRFVVFAGGAWYCVSLSDAALARWLMSPTVPAAVASLDVSLLHGLILPALGVSSAQTHGGGAGPAPASTTGGPRDVIYEADAQKAVALGRGQPGACVWLLRGIALEQVYAIAAAGITLSPKSTYFYPKVPSGVVINPFDVLT